MRRTKMRSTLKDLISQLDWQAIEIYKGGMKLKNNEITVAFAKSKKNNNIVDEIRVRIGQELLKELDWQPGDKIFPSFYPDDQLLFLLSKINGGNGYTLSKESNTSSCRLHFKWRTGDIPLEEMKPTEVDFEIDNGKLIFRAIPSK